MLDNTFTLPDKRILGFATYGTADGEPVLYFHGTPSSRLEPLLLAAYNKNMQAISAQHHLRIVAIDRPGFGLSTFNHTGSFTSFAKDAIALADHLKFDQFKILCWSGGGSYALAAAYHFPQRVSSIHIVCGFSRSFAEPGVFRNMAGNKYYFFAAKYLPMLMRGIMDRVGKTKPQRSLPQWLTQLKDADHALLNDPESVRHFTTATLNEACRKNSNGLVHEARLYYGKTGYELRDIQQPVHYWYGTEDNVVTEVHATSVEKMVPNSIMHYKKGEAHMSIYVNYIEDILKQVEKEK